MSGKVFTASNGLKVGPSESFDDGIKVDKCPLTPVETDALREFFRAEEDERLGRWRVPGHPNWVCYPTPHAYEVVVFNEDEPHYGTELLIRGSDTWPYYRSAADAYFDAHPEPKPWHDAQPGEGWIIDVGSEKYPNPQAVVVSNDTKFLFRDGESTQVDSESIRSGRRFWPEDRS